METRNTQSGSANISDGGWNEDTVAPQASRLSQRDSFQAWPSDTRNMQMNREDRQEDPVDEESGHRTTTNTSVRGGESPTQGEETLEELKGRGRRHKPSPQEERECGRCAQCERREGQLREVQGKLKAAEEKLEALLASATATAWVLKHETRRANDAEARVEEAWALAEEAEELAEEAKVRAEEAEARAEEAEARAEETEARISRAENSRVKEELGEVGAPDSTLVTGGNHGGQLVSAVGVPQGAVEAFFGEGPVSATVEGVSTSSREKLVDTTRRLGPARQTKKGASLTPQHSRNQQRQRGGGVLVVAAQVGAKGIGASQGTAEEAEATPCTEESFADMSEQERLKTRNPSRAIDSGVIPVRDILLRRWLHRWWRWQQRRQELRGGRARGSGRHRPRWGRKHAANHRLRRREQRGGAGQPASFQVSGGGLWQGTAEAAH